MIRNIFEEDSPYGILSIPLPLIKQDDVPRWVHNPNGTLTVKSAYLHDQRERLVDSGVLLPNEWKKLWKLKVQYRLKLLLRKIAANALPLVRRQF